jgi:hypothetical protein
MPLGKQTFVDLAKEVVEASNVMLILREAKRDGALAAGAPDLPALCPRAAR